MAVAARRRSLPSQPRLCRLDRPAARAATAVAVGTANFIDPTTPLRVIDGIRDYLIRHRMASVSELTGSLQI